MVFDTLTYTTTRQNINSNIPKITFWPTKNITSSSSYTVRVKKESTVIFEDSSTLTHNFSLTAQDLNGTYTFRRAATGGTSVATFEYKNFNNESGYINTALTDSVSLSQNVAVLALWDVTLNPARNYYCLADVLLIGPGGPNIGSQGGGGGGVLMLSNYPLFRDNVYRINLAKADLTSESINDCAIYTNSPEFGSISNWWLQATGGQPGISIPGSNIYKSGGSGQVLINGQTVIPRVEGVAAPNAGGSGLGGPGTVATTEAELGTNGGPGVFSEMLGYTVAAGGASLIPDAPPPVNYFDWDNYPYGQGGIYRGGASNFRGAEGIVILKLKL
jgi:hypothetical protein